MKTIRTILEPRLFDAGRCVRGKVLRNSRREGRSNFHVMFTIIIIIITYATVSFAFQYPYWISNTNVTGVVNVLISSRLGLSSVSMRVRATIRHSCTFPRKSRPFTQRFKTETLYVSDVLIPSRNTDRGYQFNRSRVFSSLRS